MNKIRVSVIVTSFNGEQFIAEQIRSIQKAIGSFDEVIISDDGSNDSTVDIIKRFVDEDSRIRFYHGPEKGLNDNIRFLLSKARGDYIFISDQDDVWHSNKIEVILSYFESNPRCLVIHHNANLIDGLGRQIEGTVYSHISFSNSLFRFFFKSHIFGCMIAFKKEFLKYDFVPKKNCFDAGIACFAMRTKRLLFVDDILSDYRRHGNNVSSFRKRKLPVVLKERMHLLIFILFTVIPLKKSKKVYE